MASGIRDPDFRLGIDFGTSHTTAILRWPDGHTRPILFDGSPLLPSAVYANPDGRLLVGRDAIHAARMDPAPFEPTPKRRIGTDADTSVTDMVAAVLERVRDEAERVSGVQMADISVTLTHPAGWGAERTAVLRDAARQAELGRTQLVAEPVAAAGYFVTVLGRSIPAGSALVVYDFGGGTFDATVVTPNDGGYEVLALAGLDDVGGVDLDEALLRHVADAHRGSDPAAWLRLEAPTTATDRRHQRHLVEDVRAAKEMLSRAESATVPVPLLELEARITRAEFDALARPFLARTVATTVAVIADAGTPVAAVLLVGGSSRIPLVRELLEQGTGIAPSTIDQPETVVAEGSLHLAGATPGRDATRRRSASAESGKSGQAANAGETAKAGGDGQPAKAGEAGRPGELAMAGEAGQPGEPDKAGEQGRPLQPGEPAAVVATEQAGIAGKGVRGHAVSLDATTQSNRTIGEPVDPWAGEQTTSAVPVLPPIAVPTPPPTAGPVLPSMAAPTRQGPQSQGPRGNPPRPDPLRPPRRYEPPTQDRRHSQPPVQDRRRPQPPHRPPTKSARAAPYRPAKARRRWPTALATAVVVVALAAAAVVVWPDLIPSRGATGTPSVGSGKPSVPAGEGPGGGAPASPTADKATAGPMPDRTPGPPFTRTDPPNWLPAGWRKLADDTTRDTVVDGAATNGGTCQYTGAGVLHVLRAQFGVSGCNMTQDVKDNVVQSVGIEAEFSVVSGCVGMWPRTGARGYFVEVCADDTVQLHELADPPPSTDTRIGGPWEPRFNRAKVVVGLLVVGAELTVIVDGVRLETVQNDSIGNGRIGVGGFAPEKTMDATITRFRAWTPTGSGA